MIAGSIRFSTSTLKNTRRCAMTTKLRLIRLPEVLEITGLSRSSIYSRMEKGTFPKRKNIGPRSIAWLESEIDHWLEERGCKQADRQTPDKVSKSSNSPEPKVPQKQFIKPESVTIAFSISDRGELTINSLNTTLRLSNKETEQLKRFISTL